jgi:hypothetical protein
VAGEEHHILFSVGYLFAAEPTRHAVVVALPALVL